MALEKQDLDEDARPKPRTVFVEGISARSSVGSDGVAYHEWSDLDLVTSLADECGDGYAELWRRHSPSVTATAWMLLGRSGPYEDVVAEVFVDLWFHPEKYDPARGSLLAFLRLKARGRSIDFIRSEVAIKRREYKEGKQKVSDDEDVGSTVIDSERALEVREALDRLLPAEREPIRLAYFSGMTYEAVAVHLGLPEGTVKSRIRMGLVHLRFSLQTMEEEVDLSAPRAKLATPSAAPT